MGGFSPDLQIGRIILVDPACYNEAKEALPMNNHEAQELFQQVLKLPQEDATEHFPRRNG